MPALRRLLTALVVLLVGSLLVSDSSLALASPTLVNDRYPLAGERSELALDGPATLIGGSESETTNVVRAFIPGKPPKVIARATIQPRSGEFSDSMFFMASGSRLVILDHGRSFTYKGSGEFHYERLLTGLIGGPLTELANTCLITPTLDESVGGPIPAHSAIAIDGELVAYDSYGCVVVQDFATGAKRVIPLEATLDPVINGALQQLGSGTTLRVPGHLVAYRRNPLGGEGPGSVVVYDFDTGEDLYQVPVLSGPATFDLESDGTLVIAHQSFCIATLSTAADPSPQPLTVPACRIQRLLDGRVLLVVPGEGKERELAWASLQTPALHPIANVGVEPELENEPATLESTLANMNETEVVYTQRSCWAANIFRTSLAEPGVSPPAPATCPITVVPHTAELTSKALRVRLHCSLGCYGNLNAHVGTAKQVRTEEGGERITGIGLPNVSTPPGGYKTLTLLPREGGEEAPTARKLVRRLQRKQRLYLRLDFEIETPVTEALQSEEEAKKLGLVYHTFPHIVVPIHLQAPAVHRQHR
jgi:hypothetical protein